MENILRLIFLVALCSFKATSADAGERCFPKNFLFGVSTAAFQIEGAWNVSDKGESMWDTYTHKYPERIFDHTNADVAADSYHLYKEDVRLLRELGVQYYRFSISWSRVLPTGFSNVISKDGVRYYNDLINELLKYNIKPLVTMYHYDLPQSLQDLGGWTNPEVAEYYRDYAEVLFETFGDGVEGWITFNEPYSFCLDGYGGDAAPGAHSSGIETYLCGHNVLRAHGMAYRLYHEKKRNGFISITLDVPWMEPASASDAQAAERALQFVFGWFGHPIMTKDGDYPPIMRARIDNMSWKQKYPRSRLPSFTKEEIEYIRGSYDILGLNSYTTYLAAEGKPEVHKVPSYSNDMGVLIRQDPSWPRTNSTWLKDVPWGFKNIINWIKKTYDNPPIVITENGMSTQPGLEDMARISFIDGYLRALMDAIDEGADVRGYTYWSLIDNFEWMSGLSERFGLYEVDYASPRRTRSPRLSAAFYANIARTGCLPSPHSIDWLKRSLE